MQTSDRIERLRQFEELCRSKGIPLTVQRRVILEAVLEKEDHPTADEILEVVQERIPGVRGLGTRLVQRKGGRCHEL